MIAFRALASRPLLPTGKLGGLRLIGSERFMSERERKEGREEFKAISKIKEEEEYFYKKDLGLIRKMRERADAERRQRELEQRKEQHWMRCPKCGAEMREIELVNVKIDRCPECNGIYLDSGEIEILLQMQKKHAFFSKIFKESKLEK